MSDATDCRLRKAFLRTFNGDDGAIVLAHLNRLTQERALGPECSDAALRHLEGQRFLVRYLHRMAAPMEPFSPQPQQE